MDPSESMNIHIRKKDNNFITYTIHTYNLLFIFLIYHLCLFVLLSAVDHETELPVVQPGVATGVKFGKTLLNLKKGVRSL